MAQDFDGVDDHLSYADSARLNLNNADFSIHFKFQMDGAPPTVSEQIFSKGNSSGGGCGGGKRYTFFYSQGSSVFKFAIDDDATRSEVSLSAGDTATLHNNSVNSVICERDAGNTIKVFIAGTEVASQADATGDIDTTCSLLLGAGRNVGDTVVRFADCNLSEFSIVKRLRSASEKTALANGESAAFFRDNLVFYARLIRGRRDEISGTDPTVGGVPVVIAHPPGMIYPSRPQFITSPVAAAAVDSLATMRVDLGGDGMLMVRGG